MRTSCLINNYNYKNYIVEAIESAINQTVPFDEIIVVDDGSTDTSLAIINEKFGDMEKVKIIAKENQGQLSSFNEGFLASSGDIIFFLDADDVYEPTYVEKALKFYDSNNECDFLFCARQEFGQSDKIVRFASGYRDYGFSIVLTLYLHKWLGAATSTISVKRTILDKILPMPEEYFEEWRVRADDCLVWGSSLAGARKYHLGIPLIKYRVHSNNNFYSKKFNYSYQLKRIMAVNRFFSFFENKLFGGQKLYELAKHEFRSIPQPSIDNLVSYCSIVMQSNMILSKKLEMIGSIFGSYLRKK